ncbi:LysE family translocator [Vibrio campbellii]|jgi:threonine/homoserine/homoserine lactone efflux protein|uniref:LysE family translocator n=1 Tax=Vibrio campbellii TaxID=680 RepID=UPI0002AE4FFC|nr:LysE family translocator [Vibrio campbellii]ARV74993.1 lysine transporter LysE [Vibrio campbellii CAIM 519 = NBRC 15631 = ATCC 25920]ELU52982.1 translocator protein, LysE family [Vibrio campbellii CAIM 519 = NBRC 15631 = ATCC 25920]
MSFENWLAFCSIAFIAAAIPGPAILLVSTHSLQFGALRALITAAGNVTGLFIMSTFSILGLSVLVIVSSTAFTIIKVIGALYLLYMGVKLWRNGVKLKTADSTYQKKFSAWSLYSQGLLISLTNPKAIIFTSALFPQFINASESLFIQFSILVTTLMMCSFLCLLSYSFLSQKLKSGAKNFVSGSIIGKMFGTTFISAGAALAISTQR